MSKEVKIGVFAVVIAVASFFLINYLRGEDIFNNEIELTGIYENAEGLVASAPVYIKGYKAGKVSSVEYRPQTRDFSVVCSIDKNFHVSSDSRMIIYAVDIMGGKGVRIDSGSSQSMAHDGDTLSTSFEMGLLDGLGQAVGPLMSNLGSTLDSLQRTVSGVNKLLSDENVDNLSITFSDLKKTMSDVRTIVAGVEGKTDELTAFIDNLSAFSDKLDGIAVQADSLLVGANGVVESIDQAEIDKLVKSITEVMGGVSNPEGSLGKLLKDDSVYNSVDSLLNEVNVLVKRISENPKKYLKISVF